MVSGETDNERERSESGRELDFAPRRVKWDETVRLIREFAGVKATDRVLDIACGEGILAFEVARHCAYLAGVDISESMVALASERAIEAGAQNVSFQVGDAVNLQFADDTFDRVFCRLGIHHFPHPAEAIGEMVRTLKSPGYLIVADIVSSEDPAWREAHNRIERARDPSHHEMLSPRQVRAILNEAGLSLEAESHWQTRRRFSDWMRIVNADRQTTERTRKLLQEAAKKKSTDLDIATQGNNIEFTHRWMACRALKLN